MPSMKAIRIYQYGTTENFTLDEVARPTAGENEVLIRIYATSVNPFDSAARAGYMAGWYSYEFPLILGLDVSGVVEEVGSGVTTFAKGDEVFARIDPAKGGAYAEYAAVNTAHVVTKPKSLDHVQAAAIPHVAVTAWSALIDAANLSEGQTILIHGAAGGVGVMAVQLAKWRGAHVITTSSANNLDFLRKLGADEVIDYNASKFEEQVHDVDVVLDTVGGETLERSWSVLKPGGLMLSLLDGTVGETAKKYNVRGQMVVAGAPSAKILTEISALIDSGKIKPFVSAQLSLQYMKHAHDLIDSRHTRGKIVLKIVE